MKNYKIGDVLIRRDGKGIRVIASEEDRMFFLAAIYAGGTVRALPHFKNMVHGNFYKKLDV